VNARLRTGSWLFAALAVVAAAPSAAQGRYSVSPDGNEVTDATTHLVWRRCAEGLRWNGRACDGKLTKFFYHEAKQHAADSGAHWRLPTRDELVTLVVKGKKKPMIDGAAFPNTPTQQFWATREDADHTDNLNAWLVNFSNGRVYGNVGQKRFPLRLVRDGH